MPASRSRSRSAFRASLAMSWTKSGSPGAATRPGGPAPRAPRKTAGARGPATDQRVLGHERHGEDRADTLVSDRVAQQRAVGHAVEAVAGRLVLAPVRREEGRAPQGGGADGTLAGPEREEPVDGEAAAHAGHELL